jgi:hypothetical protein
MDFRSFQWDGMVIDQNVLFFHSSIWELDLQHCTTLAVLVSTPVLSKSKVISGLIGINFILSILVEQILCYFSYKPKKAQVFLIFYLNTCYFNL